MNRKGVVGPLVSSGTMPAPFAPPSGRKKGMARGISAALRVASELSSPATLMLTTPFRDCWTLDFFRLPLVLINTIGMPYRYAFLLTDECCRTIVAFRIRGGLNGFA